MSGVEGGCVFAYGKEIGSVKMKAGGIISCATARRDTVLSVVRWVLTVFRASPWSIHVCRILRAATGPKSAPRVWPPMFWKAVVLPLSGPRLWPRRSQWRVSVNPDSALNCKWRTRRDSNPQPLGP